MESWFPLLSKVGSGQRGARKLAERLGLDRSYLADVEQGKRNISIVNLDAIAKGFGVSLSRLLTKA